MLPAVEVVPPRQKTSQFVRTVPVQEGAAVVSELWLAFSASFPRASARLASSVSGPSIAEGGDVPPNTLGMIPARSCSVLAVPPADPQNIKHRPGKDIPRPTPKLFPSDRKHGFSDSKCAIRID